MNLEIKEITISDKLTTLLVALAVINFAGPQYTMAETCFGNISYILAWISVFSIILSLIFRLYNKPKKEYLFFLIGLFILIFSILIYIISWAYFHGNVKIKYTSVKACIDGIGWL